MEELHSDGGRVELDGAKPIVGIAYHENLNVILVGTEDGRFFVIDPTLRDLLYSTPTREGAPASDDWDFSIASDKVIVVQRNWVGIRSEYNGILLLDSLLQTPVRSSKEKVQIELNKSEAESLCHSLSSLESSATDPDILEVQKQLKSFNKESAATSPLLCVKKEKWGTVKLELPHYVIKTCIQTLVTELIKKNRYIPQLSVASSILERLNMLHPPAKGDSDVPLDKTQMFSESARLNTFLSWPHAEYKWALPEKMAQAGFYHNPSANGDDRAMCFSCNVCLVSWEPTDEPWSEHERHSPFCPFVRGEHTHNVPLSLSFATAPAMRSNKGAIGTSILGKSSCPAAAVVGYSEGHVVVWEVLKQAKQAVYVEVLPKEVGSNSQNPSSSYCDVAFKPKEAWIMDTSESLGDVAHIAKESLDYNVNTRESVILSAVAVLGIPSSWDKTLKPVPPSVLVGGSLLKEKFPMTSATDPVVNTPFLVVYGLGPNAIHMVMSEEPSKPSEDFYISSGSTGTKQENQTFEEDAFTSYISEAELLSDSVSIFSDMNMSDSSANFLEIPGVGGGPIPSFIQKKKVSTSTPKKVTETQPKSTPKVKQKPVLVQHVSLPLNEIKHCSVVKQLLPTLDGNQVVVIMEVISSESLEVKTKEEKEQQVFGALISYDVIVEGAYVRLAKEKSCLRKIFKKEEIPISTCFIPPDVGESLLAMALTMGDVWLLKLNDFTVTNIIKSPGLDIKINAISYVSSLERLCCGTSLGSIEFYPVTNTETEATEDSKLDNTTKGESSSSTSKSEPRLLLSSDDPTLLVNRPFTVASLKSLKDLTNFENIKTSFSANVPSCWLKVIQAQKERKHPQHLQHNENEFNGSTVTWRLQRNKASKKEHMFEITLPKSTRVGHLDLKFLLQTGCVAAYLPAIEITLYRAFQHQSQSEAGEKSEIKPKTLLTTEVWSDFLKSINAELVCGPLDLGAYVDLSAQGGTVVMTSPSLILRKGRNFYLHIRAKTSVKHEETLPMPGQPAASNSNTPSNKEHKQQPIPLFKQKGIKTHLKSNTAVPWAKDEISVEFLPSFMSQFGPISPHPHHYPLHHPVIQKSAFPSTTGIEMSSASPSVEEKRKDYVGCDWLSELSITIRQVKMSQLPNENSERKALLTSESAFHSLLAIAVLETEDSSYAAQSSALDLLIWISAVSLCGPNIGPVSYQIQFIKAVESKLEALTMQGILMADRTTAHKCAKLLVLCIEVSEHFYNIGQHNFSQALLHALLNLLQYIVSCTSAGSLQWYFLLLNRVRGENLGLASESLLNILKDVSSELQTRTDPLHSLLRTRFGLYGTPFEPELFELEIPPVTKSYSHPLTYAGLYGGEQLSNVGSGTFHLWGLKDVDFRDLLVGNPLNLKWGKLGSLSPKQQIQGLLEVEPLHFTCHAASDGTRIEKIDLGITASSFSTVPLPQPYEPFTNLQTGEGSKKSEPDKMESIMMLQKALKMDGPDVMFDMIDNLKFMESNYKMVELPYSSNPDLIAALQGGGYPGMLTMVLKPNSSVVQSNNAGKITSVYSPMFTPGGMPITPMPSHSIYPTGVSSSIPHIKHHSHTHAGPSKSSSSLAASLYSSTNKVPEKLQQIPTTVGLSQSSDNDGLRLLLSPWQQMMYVPPQQAIVIDRMHSGARRFVVLDFGTPVLLTDMIIPSCSDLVSLSIDIWLHREDTDGQRLVVASDIGVRTLVVSDLQPAAICRYLKITVIGRYGMGTTKCRIPIGLFYGHTTVLPSDVSCETNITADISILNPVKIQTHLTVLSYLVEDIGCRYQLACTKLRRLLEPLLKPELSSIDHISYYLPKGKERNRLGLNNSTDQTILCAYQECITLQQQLNVAKNVVKRLQKSLTPFPATNEKALESLNEISTDKVHLLSEFLIETLLGISFLATSRTPLVPNLMPYSMYTHMNQEVCEALFRNICVLENGQCQLSTCMFMLRVCGFQAWWGKFLASTLKRLFSSGNNYLFPQDRVFILLVYLGQKSLLSWQNSNVLESCLELLVEVLDPVETTKGFLSSKLDMTLLGWVIMYMCLCLDGINCTLANDASASSKQEKEKGSKDGTCVSSRWDFIQGESALYRRIAGPNKPQEYSGFRRRIQKKMLATKQKLEELDSVATGLSQQPIVGLGMQLSALGNKIEAIKQKQASIGKNIKLQSSKHFKDLLQMRRSEMLLKRCGSHQKDGKDDSCASTDVEINLNLDPKLCMQVAKNLGLLLLRMDSTCHSDIFLITCKSLARIASACRPAISIGAIFTSEGLINLILNAVGSDFIRQKNWSSAWVSHAVMCLIQDILEGEKLFPSKSESKTSSESSILYPADIMTVEENSSVVASSMDNIPEAGTVEEMSTDDADSSEQVIEMCTMTVPPIPMEICSMSGESEDSDIEEISVHFALAADQVKTAPLANKKVGSTKRMPSCATSVSTALDARLENGVESTTEIRLRMMAVVDSEVLSQSLKAPIEVPNEVLKNASTPTTKTEVPLNLSSPAMPSSHLLSECFEKIFQMMASENCSVSIEKVLQLWISINVELCGTSDTHEIKPLVPLSSASVSSLMMAFTKNSGIGVQEWGLAFQCLHLVSNQRTLNSTDGMWLYIMSDKCFPEMILRFISGAGMNLQKNHIVSAGPTVCQHFYNFLLRLRHLSADTPWTPCLKEILLRVLSLFLSGPFITTDFPIDAFNKFLDRLTCPDLSYVNPATIISLMQQLAQILHQYIFSPNKLNVKPGGEMKSLHSTCSSTTNGNGDSKPAKPQTFDHVMFRLISFMASFASLPYKTTSMSEKTVQEFLSQMSKSFQLTEYENALVHYVAKCGDNQPKTISDIVLQMESTMMRIMSVLANPNNINVLVSGDLVSAFNIMETSVPTTVVDAVIHLFCKLQSSASQSKWLMDPIFRFLAKTPYDDFCCPFIVSETFVLLVLKVISQEDNLKQFTELKCVEAICDKFVVSARRFFNSCPTFVSILTQYIGRTDTNALFGIGSKKISNEPIDIQEGQINVAPLGTIASTNFSAHPSEVLLQSTPPHRRARTPVWSYHFFPEETYLELVISLPCAVLLREVHVIPHMTSLSTCPSAIMVEVSRDQSNTTLPMGPPVNCSGMSNIIIQLIQPEVAKTVLLRLFKPKDSSNLGLSQIRLLGSTTFSEAALQGLSAVDSVKSFESSAHWLYILDRSITVAEQNSMLCRRRIIETAVNIPDVLESCYSMLIAPVANGKAQDIYLPHVASVLFQFGNLRYEVSKQLMDALLGPVQMGFTHGMVVTNPSTAGGLSQLKTVVELLYKLCCDIPQWGLKNLMAMVVWLESCADNAVANLNCSVSAPEYFQAIASSLWQIASIGKTDLNEICTPRLLWKLYKWSIKLDGKSELKVALDHVMCSICYSKPWLFIYLMTRMQILKPMDWTEKSGSIEDLIYQWYEEESVWDRLQLEELSVVRSTMNWSKLMTLGRASQSPRASHLLQNSRFLVLLNTAIMDFWSYHTNKWLNPVEPQGFDVISTEFLISILGFYAELCNVNDVKTWFGSEGSGFWLPILNLLSSLPGSLKAAYFGTNMYELESVVIHFLSKCCWSHPENQKRIANCLREIILTQKTHTHKAVFLHSMSSFCRRLLIQLLLENEKVIVHVKSSSKYPLRTPTCSLQLKDQHPSMGVNGGDRIFYMSTHSTIFELIKLIEPHGVKMEKLAVASVEPNRFLTMLKKEQGLVEAGLEMIDQMQMAMQSGNAAKDKRITPETKRPIKTASKKLKPEGASDLKISGDGDKVKGPTLILELEEFPEVKVPTNMSIATYMAAVRQQKPDGFLDTLVFTIRTGLGGTFSSRISPSASSSSVADVDEFIMNEVQKEFIPGVFNVAPLPSTVEVFSMMGGLGMLAKHLPIVYPETLRQIAVGSKFTGTVGVVMNVDKESPMAMNDNDWVKVENSDDFYDEMLDSMVASTPLAKRAPGIRQISVTPGIPPHSMAAFGLFLSLPRFSEILLGERTGAQCMLRLVMGVTDDADGNDIFNSAIAKTLPILPFQVLRCLLDALSITTEEGRILRRVMVEVKATHFILACLAIFTHQPCDPSLIPGLQHELVIAATKAQSGYSDGKSGSGSGSNSKSDDKSHVYWAKGTGFGTGSTAQSWDVEMAIEKKKNEEENVTCLLHLMSSYINPKICRTVASKLEAAESFQPIPEEVTSLLRSSCLFNAIAGYLRNDSVLDMSRHVPLYKAVLEFLRALVSSEQLLLLLAPWERKITKTGDDHCISTLLSKMKDVVDNYSKRLTNNMKGKGKNKTAAKLMDELDDEGLAVLIPDIQMTAIIVEKAVGELILKRNPEDVEMFDETLELDTPVMKTLEERYIEEMKKLQFSFFEMISEDDEGSGIRFTVPYHYESNVRTHWARSSASRLKRLAQESVTLSSSLPIAYGSTIFVRSDNDRLDVMKVLITGPAGTPYANGCFEFDVFFPNDYPQSPMMINLETNGRQRVRFNPNLYTDGKVCLSILNTWHGRPEEKWNPQTSSLLPVLVAIQSLILNAEPYFNEPGYEKSRGTEQGERNCKEYNVGIQIATVEWAMLDQLRHPSPCFKDAIQRHFWMKRGEIISQLDQWLEEISVTCRNDKRAGKSVTGCADPVTVYKNNLALLKKEFMNLKPPTGLEDLVKLYPGISDDNAGQSQTPSSSSVVVASGDLAPVPTSTSSGGLFSTNSTVSPVPTDKSGAKTVPNTNQEEEKVEEDDKMSVDV